MISFPQHSVLIDTCVWIDFLRGKETNQTQVLEVLLEYGDAYCSDAILAELCFGAQTPAQLKKYQQYFSEMPFLPVPPGWGGKVGAMGNALRKSGYRPYLADLLIAHTANEHGAYFLTTDRDFIPYKKLFGLKLWG